MSYIYGYTLQFFYIVPVSIKDADGTCLTVTGTTYGIKESESTFHKHCTHPTLNSEINFYNKYVNFVALA